MVWGKSKYKELGPHWQDYRGEYKAWQHMIDRCTRPDNPMYKWYGLRGIQVCDRWNDKEKGFINFYKDMGARPRDEKGRPYQIDRIDNDGNYCPENCRWASIRENSRNRSDTIFIYIYGEPMCMQDVCGIFNLNRTTVGNRVKRGQDPNEALIKVLERKGCNLTKIKKGDIL